MPTKTCNKKIAANYRVEEPINNFKFRVKIVQQRPLLAELLEHEGDTRDSNFLEEECRIFSWQEKVMSPSEVSFYRDEKNCASERQQNYHKQIEERNIQGSRLYSYANEDSYYPDKKLLTTSYKTSLSTRSETALPALQNRKPFAERYNKTVIDENPREMRIRANHYVCTQTTRMHVMADLSRKDESFGGSNDDMETLLCTITYDKLHRILTIDPDFTSDDRCYTVANSSGVGFDYWLEHASENQSAPELQQQQNDLRREITERVMQRGAEIFHGLQLTSSNIQKVFLKLDILSAHDFCFDGLFVTYYLDLPEHWSTSETDRLCGRTQRCNLRNNIASFSYATDLSLDCQINRTFDKNSTLPHWPRLLLSVSSLDSWTRYRTEGYASLPLPVLSGSYKFQVPTWRATGSIINSLRRFFTGGTYELEDITYCGVPSGHSGPLLDKSNLNIVLSGYIKLTVNIVHQYHTLAKGDISSGNFHRLSTNTLMNNVENVLEQFKAARERMIQIRNFKF